MGRRGPERRCIKIATLDVPQAAIAVAAHAEQPLAIGAEGQSGDLAGVPLPGVGRTTDAAPPQPGRPSLPPSQRCCYRGSKRSTRRDCDAP